MTLLLLRHAHAGDRGQWQGDDGRRPLSERGHQQAAAIAELYAGRDLDRILSSPLTRCVQTVEPLSAARGIAIEEVGDLAEGASLDTVGRLLRGLADADAVLCTHGDVLELVVTDLSHRGVAFEDPPRWAKASTWVIDDGRDPSHAAYLPPPV